MSEVYSGEDEPIPFDEECPVCLEPRVLERIRIEILDLMLQVGHENGGLLVGRGRVIYEFLPSGQGARRGAASYTTDPEHLQAALDAAWRRHGGDVIGYLHSHPRGFGVPSQQDLFEAARMLADPDYRAMTHEVLLPIVTVDIDRSGDDHHEVNIRWFVYRSDGTLVEVGLKVMPRLEAIERLEQDLEREGFVVERHVVPTAGLALRLRPREGGPRVVLVLPPDFPDDGPRVFAEDAVGALSEVEVDDWWAALRPEGAGEGEVDPVRSRGAVDDRAAEPPALGIRVLITDARAAAIEDTVRLPARRVGDALVVGVGPERCWVQRRGPDLVALLPEGPVEVVVVPLATDFAARSAGLVQPGHLRARRVWLVGAGSVGSAMAEQLVRAGVGRFILVDPDQVSVANLCRSAYVLADVGRPKVEALADQLHAIHPEVEVEAIALDVMAVSPERRGTWVSAADVVVVAVDRPEVIQALDAELCAWVPALYPGVYTRGSGGEVLCTWPGSLPLAAVLAESRFGALLRPSETHPSGPPPLQKTWDYSTDGRLAAEPALVAQIAHVVAAATLITLALLSEGTDTEMARFFDRQYQGVFLANQRGWIFEHPLQAVWARFGDG